MQNERIFITGATGLVGSSILRLLLAKGYKNILALKRLQSSNALIADIEKEVEWINGDLEKTDWNSIIQPGDRIIHCAALVANHRGAREQLFAINVKATEELVNASLSNGVRRFIHISSIASLNREYDGQEVDPDSTFKKNAFSNDYSWTKYLGEMEVWRAHAEGLNVNVILPSIILGAGPWDSGSPAIFRNILEGVNYYPQGGSGFVDVRDVAELAVKALESGTSGHRVIASAENLSYEFLFKSIARSLGRSDDLKPLTDIKARIYITLRRIQSLITGKPGIVNAANIRLAQLHFTFDNARSKELFKMEYRPIEATVREVSKLLLESAGKKKSDPFLKI